MYMSSNFL